MSKITSYARDPKLPNNYGFKADPTADKNIKRVGGVKCECGPMHKKKKLPLSNDHPHSDGNHD